MIHSPGDDWGDIADTSNLGEALGLAFPEQLVVADTSGTCAVSQHNLVIREPSLADCVVSFMQDRSIPGSDGDFLTAAVNDAWYNPDTPGQGFFITVFPVTRQVFIAWFTFDTMLPPDDVTAVLGYPGHRWLTAFGPIGDGEAVLDVFITTGGLFNTAGGISQTDPPGADGTVRLTFDSCNSGVVEYDIPSIEQQGTIPIQRIAPDNAARCEESR